MSAPPEQAPLAARLPPLGEHDTDDVFDRFLDYVSALGLSLYPAQEEALLEVLAGRNVILATPTGSGKSLVALAMHFKAMSEDRRSVYTTPIKALANEKFFALCDAFGPEHVGLLTGDAHVNPQAQILCCTAEVLANLALREGHLADVDYAILDEFHYYADAERGVAWQVPLLTMPQTTFLLMSATLGDMTFFERALTDLNGHPTATVRSSHRPVPLDFEYAEIPLHSTVQRLIDADRAPIYLVNFTQNQCHTEAQALTSINVCTREDKRAIAEAMAGFRFDTPYGKDLSRFLRHGIGVHHGGMLPKYRRLVERLARRGLLKVISGTDTLGVGVNIPIRTVLFTRLCKFDGHKTRLLSVRDFQQICGRAGRKGFDDRGTVVAQAPEHVIENLKLMAKATADSKKQRKVHKQKAPTKGFVSWDRSTFDKLRNGEPEPLRSRFRVSHAMLLEVLGRPRGGCQAMKSLLRATHDSSPVRHRHAKTAIQMFRSLVLADIITLVPRDDEGFGLRARVNVDLQREFSLHHTLSLFVVEAIEALDRDRDSYPLDVLSLVEAILEDPVLILKKQLDALKTVLLAELKAEGVEFEQRMEELDKLEYPKPNAELLYGLFNVFTTRHPWVGQDYIHPKAAARELYEGYFGYGEFVAHHKLERAEGMVLRYLTDVYKALVQNVPEWARTDEVDDMIAYFEGVVRGVDASLLEEWEKMRDPDYVPEKTAEVPGEEPVVKFTSDRRAFIVAVRNFLYRFVRAVAARDFEAAAAMVQPAPGEAPWTGEAIGEAMAAFFEEHGHIRTDPKARGTEHTRIDRASPERWKVEQVLVDPDDHNDWSAGFVVDLAECDANDAVVARLERLGP